MRSRAKNLRRYLEISANVAIIVVAIIILLNLVWSRWQPRRELEGPKIGAEISLPGVQWGDRATLVLALQKGCRYCDESAAFYRRLHDQRVSARPRMLAVIPGEKEEVARYLSEIGVAVDDILNRSLSDIKVTATPTLLLVDTSGKVKEVWVGKLDSAREKEVNHRVLDLR